MFKKAVRVLPVAALLYLCLMPAVARAAEEKENYPDGTLHFRVPVDAKNRRQGVYTGYFPGGKKVQERAHYSLGKLDGVRERYDLKGNLVTEEAYIAGTLVFPKSPRMITANRARIEHDVQQYISTTMTAPTNPHAPSAMALARALTQLRTYRYVADIPDDVLYDDRYITLTTSAGELMDACKELTHTPPHPAGVSDELFKLGYEGCSHSNIASTSDLFQSINMYMDDSDSSNVDRLGHRRWCLNPSMGKTGLGAGSHYSAMYSFDGSRKEVPDFDYVAWPPRGYCPHDLFRGSQAWSVSFNPNKFKVPDDVKATISPANLQLAHDAPLELNYSKIDHGGYGIDNCVIFRPKNFAVKADVLYQVSITGIKDKDDKSVDITYYVAFF